MKYCVLQISKELVEWKGRYETLCMKSDEEGGALAQITKDYQATRTQLVETTSEYAAHKEQASKVGTAVHAICCLTIGQRTFSVYTYGTTQEGGRVRSTQSLCLMCTGVKGTVGSAMHWGGFRSGCNSHECSFLLCRIP